MVRANAKSLNVGRNGSSCSRKDCFFLAGILLYASMVAGIFLWSVFMYDTLKRGIRYTVVLCDVALVLLKPQIFFVRKERGR